MLVAGLVTVGCGDDGGSAEVPDNGVASVDGVVITKTAYDQMMASTRVANPDTQQARIAAMQILMQREWGAQEAEDEGVKVSDAEVRRALLEQRAQFFKTEKQYQNYLRRSKRTEKDLYAGMKQKLIMDELSARAVREAPKIDDERVEQYYEKNRDEFKLPQRYLVHTLITKTEAQADEARRDIEDGMGWKEAIATHALGGPRAFSPEARTLAETGVKEVDKKLATTEAGEKIVVKTQYGWLLIGVEKVTPAEQLTLEKAKGQIRERLVASRREDAANAYIQDFQEEYKEKSVCAEGYLVAECSNGPDENPTPKPPEQRRASPDDSNGEADK